MATLNISIPDQLRAWVSERVNEGKYSSASDYLRDLIREDIRHHETGVQQLSNYLNPLFETPDERFVSVSADEVKLRARNKLRD